MSKPKNTKDHIQIEAVDKIIKMYPDLKKDRASIITDVMGVKNKNDSRECILVKFKYKDETFYRDKNGSIWSADAKIVGSFGCKRGEYKYFFFKDLAKSKAKTISIDKYRF